MIEDKSAEGGVENRKWEEGTKLGKVHAQTQKTSVWVRGLTKVMVSDVEKGNV